MVEKWNKVYWLELHPEIRNIIQQQLKTVNYSKELQIRILNLTVKTQSGDKPQTYKIEITFDSEQQYSVEIFKLQILEDKKK